MTTYLKVVRYHLVQPLNFLILPWAILAFVFGVEAAAMALTPVGNSTDRPVGGLASLFVFLFVLGLLSVARSVPFALTLGLSRRTYYLGTTLLAVVLAAVAAAVITAGQAVERATDGWGLSMGFFRVPYVLDGPWYLTWLTSFVALTVLFAYGMWFGLVYRRWNVVGVAVFGAGQVVVVLVAALATTWAHSWHDVGRFFTDLSASGVTGLAAVAAVVLLVGGFATMRRLTV